MIYGAPVAFPVWRPGQEEAFFWATDSATRERRHIGLGAPTGVGKSLIAYLLAQQQDGRTVILTSRKGLADQYKAAFPDVAEIRGIRNYWDHRTFERELQAARDAKVVITNYAFWLAGAPRDTGNSRDDSPESDYRDRLGEFSLLVMDEAHESFDELSNHLAVELTLKTLRRWDLDWPDNCGDSPDAWARWARSVALPKLKTAGKDLSPEEADERLTLRFKLTTLVNKSGEWIGQREQPGGAPWIRLSKVWPADEAEKLLFRGIKHVLWLSATLRPKSFELLDVKPAEYAFREFEHPFNPDFRPVYWLKTARMTPDRNDPVAMTDWVLRLDQLISRAPDALGLIHTVSYRRAKDFMARTRWADKGVLMTHEPADTAAAVESFLQQEPHRVLVSPVLVAGWDLGAVKWQAIGKLPFPMADPLSKRRREVSPDLQPFQVAQDIVQTAGRIVRGPEKDDAGETWIIDDAIQWFQVQYQEFFPRWFNISKVNYLPAERLWD